MALKKAKGDAEITHATQIEEPSASQKHKSKEEESLAEMLEAASIASATSNSSEEQVLKFVLEAFSQEIGRTEGSPSCIKSG